MSQGVRVLGAEEVGVRVESFAGYPGRRPAKWKFQCFSDEATGNKAKTLSVGDEVAFDGREYGSPLIAGTVVTIEPVEFDELGAVSGLLFVTVQGEVPVNRGMP